MTGYIEVAGLQIDQALYEFVEREVTPGTNVNVQSFWTGFAELVTKFGPINRELLDLREALQRRLDEYHSENRGEAGPQYERFLRRLGYLATDAQFATIRTVGVDEEVSAIAAPQLIAPLSNARYALNAANARWGSLYDALYGTDAIATTQNTVAGLPYDPNRGKRVIKFVRRFLDDIFPLTKESHRDVQSYSVHEGKLLARMTRSRCVGLANPEQFAGYRGVPQRPSAILLRHNGLHLEIKIDPACAIGAGDNAGVADVLLESAVTTIMDLEDSVAAVDADDKIALYRNLLGLMKGTLSASFDRSGVTVERKLNPDRLYHAPSGETLQLPGRSLMMIRNVGMHMYTDAVLDSDHQEIPEGLLDAAITSLIATHDLKRHSLWRNSRTQSIYIVKPKLHGPDETKFTNLLFGQVEKILGLPPFTLKLGLMDEERRTTLNLPGCLEAAADRIVFINTGFLDRTGDEIHTAMEAGPVLPKSQMRSASWMLAYEDWNVEVGLAAGASGKAQIGKGMWVTPDRMAALLDEKIAHPMSGASTAWVPSPTAATLHAIHYHKVNVATRQDGRRGHRTATVSDLLAVPVMTRTISIRRIQKELDDNVQRIVGYLTPWITRGIGCSKVLDLNNVAFMEDRATLRISSQQIANWLHHGLLSERQILDTLNRMLRLVDQQNAQNRDYVPMRSEVRNLLVAAAKELVLNARSLPNGYTETVLHAYRRMAKKCHLSSNVAHCLPAKPLIHPLVK